MALALCSSFSLRCQAEDKLGFRQVNEVLKDRHIFVFQSFFISLARQVVGVVIGGVAAIVVVAVNAAIVVVVVGVAILDRDGSGFDVDIGGGVFTEIAVGGVSAEVVVVAVAVVLFGAAGVVDVIHASVGFGGASILFLLCHFVVTAVVISLVFNG